jgi:hypothetical protein
MQHRPCAFLASIGLAAFCAMARAADDPGASDRSSIADHARTAGAAVARQSKAFGAAVKEGDASVKGAHEVRDSAKGVADKTKNAVAKPAP